MPKKLPNSYRNIKWLKFREEIIERDGDCCSVCFRSTSDGIVLQVHHKIYISGKLPWEYNEKDCITLCKGCHAREHGEIRPNSDWDFVSEEDLGDLDGECELCGTSIRYVFTVHHPKWEPLVVGIDCCDRLTGTKTASHYVSHINTFLKSSRWKLKGHNLKIRQKKIDVEIIQIQGGFNICMNGLKSHKIYQTIDEAKIRIFQSIDDGSAIEYLKSHNKIRKI